MTLRASPCGVLIVASIFSSSVVNCFRVKVQEENMKLQSNANVGRATGAHVRRLQNMDHAPKDEESDSTTACGTTGYEKGVASALRERLQSCVSRGCKNPFQICFGRRFFSMTELSQNVLKLCEMGKLAKNGNFLASEDGAILVKQVEIAEAETLVEWGEKWTNGTGEEDSQYPGGSPAFKNTLLVPLFVSFQCLARPFVVMPNTTRYLERIHSNHWLVHRVYDAKPLPNLGAGLVKLFKDLHNEWGSGLPQIDQWSGWSIVRSQLQRDLKFLDRVVDFSLFVHVLKWFGDEQSELGLPDSSVGCVVDPSRTTMVCFNVLDYLTPLTWKRKLESKYKAQKFDDYGKKFLFAFDCIGDASESKCANYNALASITEATSFSKAMAKSAFVGAQAFPNAYTCTVEEPHLQYRKILPPTLIRNESFGEVIDAKTVMQTPTLGKFLGKEVIWKESSFSEMSPERWLQSIASPEVGTRYIGHACSEISTNERDYDCTFATVMEAFTSMRPKEAEQEQRKEGASANSHWRQTRYEVITHMDDCMDAVNEFATETYTSYGDKSSKMHNVLWAPSQKSVIAVRGLPKKVPIVGNYEHKKVLQRAREKHCFLRMQYFKCSPIEGAGVYINYQQHFGNLEVMVVSTREQYSEDVELYYDQMSKGTLLVSDPLGAV